MSNLQKDALGVQVMSPDAVGCIRDAARDMTKEHLVDVVRRMAMSHERLRMELDGAMVVLDELHQHKSDITSEVMSVLSELDNLANVWGDEGVFRRCRDRLRILNEPHTASRG